MKKLPLAVMLSILLLLTGAVRADQTFTLKEAVQYALTHSPVLTEAAAEVQVQEGQAQTAQSRLYPQIDLYAGFTQSRFERGYPPATPPTELRFDESLFSGGVRLNLLAWDFHRTRLQLEAIRHRIQAAQSTVERRRQTVSFEVAELYLKALTFEDLTRAAEARQSSLQAFVEQTHALVEGGRAVPADELKVRTQLARIVSDLATLEAQRHTTLGALAAAMGLHGELPKVVYTPPRSSERQPEPGKPLIETAWASRPDLKAAEHTLQAAQTEEKSLEKSRLPRLTLHASSTQYASGSPESFVSLIGKVLPGLSPPVHALDNAVADWAVGATLTFPLFDGGQREGRIHAAEAQYKRAQAARQRLKLIIAREFRTASAELESAQARVVALKESVDQAEEILRNEQLKYQAGKSVINFVLEAEAVLLTNQSLLSQAQRSASIAELALDLSLGHIAPDRLPIP